MYGMYLIYGKMWMSWPSYPQGETDERGKIRVEGIYYSLLSPRSPYHVYTGAFVYVDASWKRDNGGRRSCSAAVGNCRRRGGGNDLSSGGGGGGGGTGGPLGPDHRANRGSVVKKQPPFSGVRRVPPYFFFSDTVVVACETECVWPIHRSSALYFSTRLYAGGLVCFFSFRDLKDTPSTRQWRVCAREKNNNLGRDLLYMGRHRKSRLSLITDTSRSAWSMAKMHNRRRLSIGTHITYILLLWRLVHENQYFHNFLWV